MGKADDDNNNQTPSGAASSSSSSSDNSQQHNKPRRPSPQELRYRQEHKMSDEFSVVLGRAVEKLNRLEVIQEEQEFAWKFLKSGGIMEGTTAAVFAFICLNRVPRYWARYVARNKQQQQQPYVLDKTPTPKNNPYQTHQPTTSPFQQPNQRQVEEQVNRSRNKFLFTVFELMFDSAMSIGVGICTAIIVTDEKEITKTITDIPLQPGRSLLAEQACPPLIDEYRRQWKLESNRTSAGANNNNNNNIKTSNNNNNLPPFDRREILKDPHHSSLQVLLNITQNCQHRHVMEQRIRDEQGLSMNVPVEIPEQGVMPETEDPLLNRMLEEEGKDYRDEIYAYQDVANFVKDQEEQAAE